MKFVALLAVVVAVVLCDEAVVTLEPGNFDNVRTYVCLLTKQGC
jgi:hypothetical protein